MDLYADNILDHYRHPRGKGTLPSPSATHEEKNLSCGDELTVQLTIEDGKIADVTWQGTGCAISQAAMSMLFEELIGMKTDTLLSLSANHIYQLLGVPVGPRRVKCALLGLHTLKNAVYKLQNEPVQSWNKTVATEN